MEAGKARTEVKKTTLVLSVQTTYNILQERNYQFNSHGMMDCKKNFEINGESSKWACVLLLVLVATNGVS